MQFSKTTLTMAAGLAVTIFIGYCIYFDNKRRKDPDYKKKVSARRKLKRQNAPAKTALPQLKAIEKYFLRELQLGEAFIENGENERGVEHLANAVIVCGRPGRLLQMFRTNLLPEIYDLLTAKIEEYTNRESEEDIYISARSPFDNSFQHEYLDNITPPYYIDDLE